MKPKPIRFFTPQDNTPTKSRKGRKAKPAKLEGHISPLGKLVLPTKIIDKLELKADSVRFLIGTDQGKRKLKSLYLVPTCEAQAESFELVKAARSYTIDLALILQKGGIDFKTSKYQFTLAPFPFAEGVTGYTLALRSPGPKPVYTGKPRGRKPKVAPQEG